jgi:hypothetical protein
MRGEGLQGYAEHQAALRQALHADFTQMWQDILRFVKMTHDAILHSMSAWNREMVTGMETNHVD